MVILGTKFLVWCALSVLFVGCLFGVSFTFSDVGVTVTISDYEGVLKCGSEYLISVSGPSGYKAGSIYIQMANGNAYFDIPSPGIPVGGSGYYTLTYGIDGGVCEVRTVSVVNARFYSPTGSSSRSVSLNGSVTVVSDSCTGYDDPPGPPCYLSVSVFGEGSVMVVGEFEVATEKMPRVYEVSGGDEICFQCIPGIGNVFNSYSVDGGEWVISDGSFCLTVNDDMTVVFRFVDELSFDEDDNKRASEWWGTYERSSSSTVWEDWSIVGVNWAHFDEDGDMVYMDSTLIGSWQDHLAGGNGEVYLFTPSWFERFWVYRNGKHFGYVNESNQVVIGDNEGTVMGSFVESCDWWGGEEPGYGFSGFGGLVSGPLIANNEAKTTFWFEDEWGKRVFEVEDRFWTGFWDYPGYDPASPTTYPPEPFWKADPPEPPGEEDNSWLADLLKDFFEKYFVYDRELLKWLAEDLRDKAARKFPFCLFWIPEKLPSSSEDVSVPLLDLSMFVGKDFKVDFYNNEYVDELAETTRNISRYIIWLLFIFHLRDIITPVMVID